MLLFTIVINIVCVSANFKNNVCNTYLDYYIKPFSKSCSYNPDVGTDMPELVTQHNYPLENYSVVTADGYILKVFRLPQSSTRKGVVFLQHPALSTCTIYLDKGNVSLAYSLYNEGYEVWLGNFRGNYYSRKHLTLSPDTNQFWNFSYHEMGLYDIPAQVELASNISESTNIAYVSYSLSTTAAVVYASMLPDHAKKYINLLILMAPVVYLKHIRSTPIKLIAPFGDAFYSIAYSLKQLEFLPHSPLVRTLSSICYKVPFVTRLCASFFVYLMGPGKEPFDELAPSLIPIAFSQNPAGVALKVFSHYAQNVVSKGKLQFYDYGKKKNEMYYGSKSPPDYPIGNISIPVHAMIGKYDVLATRKDLDAFLNKLPEKVKQSKFSYAEKFNHISFAYSKDLDKEVNKKIKLLLDDVFH